jgi:hypothetical protein
LTFIAALLVMLSARSAEARSAGIDSTQFANVNNGCLNCHGGGTAPDVHLSASATMLTPGQQITLTFTVTTPNATPPTHPNGAAGFNLRTDKPGTFAVGGPSSTSTRIVTGRNSQSEATHSAPKEGEPATFTVLWTPNAATTGDVTFIAWGNAVNQNGNNQGDLAASTTLVVNVCTAVAWYHDVDGDGYGNAGDTTSSCAQPAGYVSNNTDCNDGNGAIHPGATEICNGVDDNCAGGIDDGLPTSTFYLDADGDGYGRSDATKVACSLAQAGAGYVVNNGDCDDGNMAIHPGATEVCNGLDENCTGIADDGLPTATFYFDHDGDGYGDAAATKVACNLAQAGPGYVANNTDCNDGNGAVHPGAVDECNGIDDDCNGTPDNGLAMTTFYRDADGDGYGAADVTKMACSLAVAGAGYVTDHTDCNDADKNIFPGAPEICANMKDDNCNGVVDTDAPANSTFYKDTDGDGYGSATSGTATACSPPAGYVSNNTDCNDADGAIHPGATEVCNGKDDNCAGGVDEGLGTISCGEGACRTTVDACVAGVPQACTPKCPDAGVDAGHDVATVEAAASDTGGARDVTAPIDAGAEGAATDAAHPSDAPGDVSAPAPDAPNEASPPPDVRAPADAGGSSDARQRPDAAVQPGANEDSGATGDSGCSCRTASSTRGGGAAAMCALLLLALARRRKSTRKP